MEKKSDHYDVVIIGTGVAGALTAHRLAKAGFSVLMLEAGESGRERVELVGSYINSITKSLASPYLPFPKPVKNMAPTPDGANDYYDQPLVATDPMAFQSTYERRVGGSTWHWLGNCPRLLPSDFQTKFLYNFGVNWPISYSTLESWYCEAEKELGVAGDHEALDGLFGAFRSSPFPMRKIWPSYSDLQITEALKGSEGLWPEYNDQPLELISTPQARNSEPYDDRPVCAGNSSCVPICPIGAKYDASVHVTKAKNLKAELREKSIVTKIIVGEDGMVQHIIYKDWDGEENRVSGGIYILAANAIESAKILLMSGIANESDQVGRNLMDHPQGEGLCTASEPIYPFRGPPTTSGIDKFRDGAFRKDFCAFRLSMGNDGGGRTVSPQHVLHDIIQNDFGTALREKLRFKVTRQFRISFLAEMKPLAENRITLSPHLDDAGIPRPKIDFTIDDYTMKGFDKIAAVMGSILQKLNPIEPVLLPDHTMGFKAAGHILGTCRMGDDPLNSVVDADCRFHQHKNLFMAGGAVFPTGGTANPTLTIAALSLRIADCILRELKKPSVS